MHIFGQAKSPFECFKYNSALCVTEIGICALYFIVIRLFSHKLNYWEMNNVKSGKKSESYLWPKYRIGTDLTKLSAKADLPKSV